VTGFDDRHEPHVKPWNASPTTMELYATCPLAWSLKYELGVEEIETRALRIGRLMAKTVERYLTHCFTLGIPTDVTAIEDLAREVYVKEGVGLGPDALDEVIKICGFYVQANALDLDRLAGVEVWLPPDGVEPLLLAGRPVRGKVDSLYFDDEGRLATIVDDKTNWSAWPEGETPKKLQARLYPALIFHSFPEVEECEVVFRFIRWPGVERVVRFTRAEADWHVQQLEAVAAQMQEPGKRPATPSSQCARCGYVLRCPRFKSAKEQLVFPVPTSPDEASKLGEDLVVLEAGLERIRELLRSYTDANGPVRVGTDKQVGYFKTSHRAIGARKFVAWCEEQGIDPFDYLNVPTREVEKLARKRRSLAELTEIETSTRFDSRRPEEDVAQAS
jgi:hypothetical protein